MPIFPRFPAHRGNGTLPKTTIFALPTLPGAPPERVLFSQDHPGTPPRPTFELLEVPSLSQEGPGASNDHMKFTKLTCSKPWKYVYLTLWDLKKSVPDHFFTLRGPTRDSPESSPFPSRSPLGTQKGPPERSRTPDGPPGAPFWPVF